MARVSREKNIARSNKSAIACCVLAANSENIKPISQARLIAIPIFADAPLLNAAQSMPCKNIKLHCRVGGI
jgi:hypothetical protein